MPPRALILVPTRELARQVADALDYAHQQGVIHQDIKPGNIMLASDRRVKVGDFGLATDNRSRTAVEGLLVGTVAYLPPEQALGRRSDARADLYSAAVLPAPPFPNRRSI